MVTLMLDILMVGPTTKGALLEGRLLSC